MASTVFLTWEDARRYLGVSRNKMSQLIKSGALHSETTMIDKRVKMFRQSDLEKIKRAKASR